MYDAKNMLVFYVESMQRSLEFYEELLSAKPVEQSNEFSMFALPSGLLLGLWLKSTVEPAASFTGQGHELLFSFDTMAQLDKIYREMKLKEFAIEQELVLLDFGYTFVLNDPDNHRVRFFTEQIQTA